MENFVRISAIFLAAFLVAFPKMRQSSANIKLDILNPCGEDKSPTCALWLVVNALSYLINGSIEKRIEIYKWKRSHLNGFLL